MASTQTKIKSLDLALAYVAADAGRFLFPIKKGAKSPPLIADNLDRASNDPAQIRAWSKQFPDCNWGLALRMSHLIVADVDTKPGKVGQQTYDALDLEYGWPKTETVTTPSGGLHYYFDGPHVFALGEHGFGKDIDSPNYVLIPGCRLADGTSYEAIDDTPVIPAPEWFSEFLKPREMTEAQTVSVVDWDKPGNVEWAISYLKADAPCAIEGQGGERTTFGVAAIVRDHGISEPKCLDLMMQYYNVPGTCDPEWEAADLAKKINNAYSYSSIRAPGAGTAEADFANDPVPVIASPSLTPEQEAARAAETERRRAGIEPQPEAETWPSLRSGWAYIGQQKRFVRIRDGLMYEVEAFNNYFANVRIADKPTGATIGKWAFSRPFGQGLPRFDTFCFEPGKPLRVGGAFNLYTPPKIIAAEGDTSLWNDHLKFIFPREADRTHLLNWIAWVLQHLGKKPKHALVIAGEIQGTGKSWIADVLAELIGQSNRKPVSQITLELPHNGWAMKTKLVTVEEIRASSTRDAIVKKLHDAITQEWLPVDEKNMPPLTIRDVIAYLLMTNKFDAIPMDDSDRRYLVLKTLATPKEKAYYVKLFALLDDPIALGAIKWELEHRDLGNYTAQASAPFTVAKAEMIEASAGDVQHHMIANAEAPPFCHRLVTIEECVEALPRHLKIGRVSSTVKDVLRRKFNGVSVGQIRTGGRNDPRIHAWAIGKDSAQFAKYKTPHEMATVYAAEHQPGATSGDFDDSDPSA
ncbi:MAG TPA: bifunctional DNA primase/polymerase [Pseudolabrys sp.]